MKVGERIPIHNHDGFDSGGLVAASTVVSLSGGGITVTGGTEISTATIDALGAFVRTTLGGKETLYTVAAAGTATTLDLVDGNVFDVTLSAGTATLSFTGAAAGKAVSFSLLVQQDATGGRLVTWPGAVVWPDATAPTLGTAAAAVDWISFVTLDAGTTWYGFPTGGSGGSDITVEDEGTPLATAATTLDFVGAGVTASGTGAEKTITIAGVTEAAVQAVGHYEVLMASGTADPLLTSDGLDYLYVWVT